MALKPISVDKLNRITCLVIAPYGMGKTSLIRTILGQEYAGKDDTGRDLWRQAVETGERVCVLSAESGLLSVRDLVLAGLVEGYEIDSFQDMKEAFGLLSTDQAMKERYSWVFIDSLSEISDRCLESAKAKHSDNGYGKWDDYDEQMKTLVKGFRDLSCYSSIFTCLPTVSEDDQKRRYIGPAVAMKGLREKLPSLFDEVFYLDQWPGQDGQPHRALLTQPWQRFPAKDRSGQLATIEKPDLLLIRNKILNGGN